MDMWNGVLLLVGLCLVQRISVADGVNPNIILFVADDVGYGDLSCYGHPSQIRSGIDALADDGMRFTTAYTPESTDVASRGALLTGRLPIRLGLYGNTGTGGRSFTPTHSTGLPDSEKTLPEILRENGYSTGMVGKWNLGINSETATDGKHLPQNHGFDYVGHNLPLSNSWNCISRPDRSSPDPKECFLYNGDKIIEQPFRPESLTSYFLEDAKAFISNHTSDTFFLYVSFSNNHISLATSDGFKDTSPLGIYGDSTNEMGSAVKDIMALVADSGLKDNTLSWFVSDNGPYLEMCSEGGYEGALTGGKFTSHEGGIRVPFIVSWPSMIPGSSISRHAVSSMDILPTIVDIIGVSLPADKTYDGTSIKSILFEDKSSSDMWGFEQPSQEPEPHMEGLFFYSGETLTAMRFGRYKLHFYTQPDSISARSAFGAFCVNGVPQRELIEGCLTSDCLQQQIPPAVYLIDEDAGEGFRFYDYNFIRSTDVDFQANVDRLLKQHTDSIDVGQELLSNEKQKSDLQPCCSPPKCECEYGTGTGTDSGVSSVLSDLLVILFGLSFMVVVM